MANVLKNWFNDHEEEIKQEKEKAEKRGQKTKTLQDGDNVIKIKDIKEISEAVFEFKNNDGSVNTVKRYFYWFNPQDQYNEEDDKTYPMLIPKSVHFDILDQVNEYANLEAVKVTKTGKNKDTEYKVFPQLEK